MAWSYDFFENGEPVSRLHRRRFRERIDLQRAFPNPYCTSEIQRSYYHWFEANDESRVKVVSTASSLPEVKPAEQQVAGQAPYQAVHPSYWGYLSICGSEATAAARVIADLQEDAFRSNAIYVVGPPRLLEELKTYDIIRGRMQVVSAPEPVSHEGAFRIAVAASGGEWDFVFSDNLGCDAEAV